MKRSFTFIFFFISFLFCNPSFSQDTKLDSLFAGADTTAVMDSLFKDLDAFINSLSFSESFINVSAGISSGFFISENKTSSEFEVVKKVIYSPAISYYHKSGLGISVAGYLIKDDHRSIPYQFALSPSYDYIKNKSFSTGFAFTHSYTRKDLSFYTSPVRNDFSVYFNYRKSWLRPAVSLSYAWGSETGFGQKESEYFFKKLKAARKQLGYTERTLKIKDFSTVFSVRHNFKWYKLSGKQDLFILTPALLFIGGSQNFDFTTSFTGSSAFVNYNLLAENQTSQRQRFNFHSAAFVLRLDYSLGNFYIQPQALLNYYLQHSDKRFNNMFSVTAGYNFFR